jgi:hypothetical protein
VFGKGKRKAKTGPDPTADVYDGLRGNALASVANGLAPPSPDHPDVSGVVVDIPAQGGFATVVALTDNTTSMYTSTGGGTIGAGQHEKVANATQRLLSVVQDHLASFRRHDDVELPAPGLVRFHILSPSGPRGEDVPEDSYWGRAPHQLMPVIAAVQDVVAAMRGASPPS